MSSFKNCFLLALLSTLTFSIYAQVLQPNTKPNPKVNYDRLKRVDAVINEFVQQNKIIGVGEMTNEIDATMKRLAKLPLEVQPGEKWNYSLSTDVLGHVIEIISGVDLETFFQKRIFAPLGMKDSYFNLPADKHKRLTAIYTPDSTGRLKKWANGLGIPADFPNIKKSYFSGGGGLVSTAYDYAIFLQMLLNKGTYNGVTLLSPRSIELMTSNQVGPLFGSGAFGLDFRIVTPAMSDELSNVGSFGWGGAFSTAYWVDPKAQVIGLLMTQQFPASPSWNELQGKFKVAVYQSLR